jgi:arylsulfatase A-like enzyme/Flp pilus assembly protein TadD
VNKIVSVSSSHRPGLIWSVLCRMLPVAVLLVTLGPRATARPATPSHATPVLLITVDTLRADRLGCYGSRTVRTPAMDSLAAQGVRFDSALTQVPITLPSHIVILSGTYPMWNGVRDFTARPLRPDVGLIAEAFKRQGYATAAFVSAFVLDSSWGLKRGFETYDDRFDPRQFETRNPGNIQRRAGETVDRLLAWFHHQEAGSASARRFFVWLHLYDPHSPYDPPEPFRTRYAGHLYDGEVAYADSQLGRVFDYLRKVGLYDQTLIVLLSDHGESLGDHGEDEHGFFTYRSTLRVPLIIKLPRGAVGTQAPRVVRAPVGTIDVAPTLLDLAQLRDPLSRQFQGRSLASLALGRNGPQEGAVYSETYYPRDSFGWSALRSLSTVRYQYIDAPRQELYELAQDPGEKHNMYGERTAEAAALRDQLLDIERRYTNTAAAASSPASLSTETVEKLKSLGYLAYSAPAPTGSEQDLPDPKDRLETFKSILRAEDLASAGRFERSDALLDSLRPTEPKLYLIPFMLGENAAKERRWTDSERELLACLKLNPAFDQAVMGLARAELAQGKFDQARTWLELAASQNPHNFLAYHGLGIVAQTQRRNDEARRDFEKSIEEKPDYAPSQQGLGVVLVEMRNYQEALKPLRRALDLGERTPVLLNYLGTVYSNTGQSLSAIRSYREALSLKPDYTAARLNLAFAYKKTGDPAGARREFGVVCSQDRALCEQYQESFQ